jgi:hypothetical protein
MEKGIATFEERLAVEDNNIQNVYDYLYARPDTVGITKAPTNVQKSDDIDFSWLHTSGEDDVVTSEVELKVDTQGHRTGNMAFETVSNELRNTTGCFLRTKSDLLFYYLVGNGELWVMDTKKVQHWFLEEMESKPFRFQSFETYTKVGNSYYSSYGRLVPISELEKAGKSIGLRKANLI